MATIEEVQAVNDAILASQSQRPDFGTWGTPADRSLIVRQTQPPGSGSSQTKVEDLPMPNNTFVARRAGDTNIVAAELDDLVSYGATAPGDPVPGALWYDTGASALKQWDGAAWQGVGGGAGLPVDDTTAIAQDDGDNSKKVRFECSSISSASTRVLTVPDQDVNLAPNAASGYVGYDAPKLGGNVNLNSTGRIFHQSGSEVVKMSGGAATPNYLNLASQGSGAEPYIEAQGTDTNIDLRVRPKGTGDFVIGSGSEASIGLKMDGANAGILGYDTTTQKFEFNKTLRMTAVLDMNSQNIETDGNLVLTFNSDSNRTFSILNPATGNASLAVGDDISCASLALQGGGVTNTASFTVDLANASARTMTLENSLAGTFSLLCKGPLTIGDGTTTDPVMTFDGSTSDGTLTWDESLGGWIFSGTAFLTLPKGTTAQQPTGLAGQIRYDTTTNKLRWHNGTSWGDIGGSPAGSDHQVQFNDNGNFGAEADFTWNNSTNLLAITGVINVDNCRMDGSTFDTITGDATFRSASGQITKVGWSGGDVVLGVDPESSKRAIGPLDPGEWNCGTEDFYFNEGWFSGGGAHTKTHTTTDASPSATDMVSWFGAVGNHNGLVGILSIDSGGTPIRYGICVIDSKWWRTAALTEIT